MLGYPLCRKGTHQKLIFFVVVVVWILSFAMIAWDLRNNWTHDLDLRVEPVALMPQPVLQPLSPAPPPLVQQPIQAQQPFQATLAQQGVGWNQVGSPPAQQQAPQQVAAQQQQQQPVQVTETKYTTHPQTDITALDFPCNGQLGCTMKVVSEAEAQQKCDDESRCAGYVITRTATGGMYDVWLKSSPLNLAAMHSSTAVNCGVTTDASRTMTGPVLQNVNPGQPWMGQAPQSRSKALDDPPWMVEARKKAANMGSTRL